jgi:hypothetical protein
MGNPALQTGWMSEKGCKLEFKNGEAICAESGELYILSDNKTQKKD